MFAPGRESAPSVSTRATSAQQWRSRDDLLLPSPGDNYLDTHRQRILVEPSVDAASKSLVSDWIREPSQPHGRPRVLTDLSPEATSHLNGMLQSRRLDHGELSRFRRFNASGLALYQGDSVQAIQTNRHFGIMAGDLAVVQHVAATPLPGLAKVTLRLERTGKPVTVTPNSYPHLQLAYALNAKEVTGFECDRVFALQASANSSLSADLLGHARLDAKLYLATPLPHMTARPSHEQRQLGIGLQM